MGLRGRSYEEALFVDGNLVTRDTGPRGNLEWFAIQTRSRHEKCVDTQLEGQGLRTFLPVVAQLRRWSDRRKTIEVPLFPGYIFVRVVGCVEDRIRVLQVRGVVCFVGSRSEGTPIPEAQIADIRNIVNKATCRSYPFLKVGQRVRIRGGCLDGIEGIYVTQSNSRILVVSIPLIQRSLAVQIDGFDIEPL